MKHLKLMFLTAIAASFIAACGGPAANNTATTNTNTKPANAAPTAETLLAIDQKANDAYFKGDSTFFEGALSDKFVMYEGGQRIDKAAAVKMVGSGKCEVKEGWKLEDPKMSKVDNDTYVLSYKATADGSCDHGGKAQKIPSPVRAASMYARNGDKWDIVYHGETMIMEPAGADNKKADAKADDTAKADDKKAADTKADDKKAEPMKADDKKADLAKADDKKADDKKAEANGGDKMATVDNKNAEPAKTDANTEALMRIHQSGWDAWQAKDPKKLTEISTSTLSVVDPTGMWISGQGDVVKRWTEDMKCENVNNVKVSDGFASAVSPTVEILTLKGTADGTCDGQKNGPLYQTAVYVKEGSDWKLAFMFESPAK